MRRALATLAIGAIGLVAAGCGSDKGSPIPQKDADGLVKNIEQVRRQTGPACVTLLKDTLPNLEQRAQDLDPSVGSDVRQTIKDAVDHLRDLANQECEKAPATTTTDQSTSDTSTDTVPSTTESTDSTSDSTSNSTSSTDSTSDTTPNTDTTQTTPPTTDTTPTTTGGGGVTPPSTPTTPSSP